MFFKSKKQHKVPYLLLLVVLLSVILVILGFALMKNIFFPLILSAAWAIILKLIKGAVKNIFFPSEK